MRDDTPVVLPSPAVYVPFVSGRYDVSPSLRGLGADFGNGAVDRQAFQFDRQFPAYRENKLRCRTERLSKYVLEAPGGSPLLAAEGARWMAGDLAEEHPALFSLIPEVDGWTLHCRLTGEDLRFTADGCLATEVRTGVQYASAWDALGCQVQEDLALVAVAPDGADSLAALHVCAPSSWRPEEKLGLSFGAVHAPVPGIEPTARAAPRLNRSIVSGKPFVRFVWGIAAAARLNRHPDPFSGQPLPDSGRAFDPKADPPFWLRVERQVLVPLPGAGGYLFLIRLYCYPGTEVRTRPGWAPGIRSALAAMTDAQLDYKGLTESRDALMEWLASID